MKRKMTRIAGLIAALPMALGLTMGAADAGIPGRTGPSFSMEVREHIISVADGNTIYMWGYGIAGDGQGQYPGPTLIVNQGDTVSITLKNMLTTAASKMPVSMVFPGFKVTATGGDTGLLTQEAPPDGTTTVTYSFVASTPGTYMYYSGTQPDIQVEMGLVGALIVRPTGFDHETNRIAYGDSDSAYDFEHLQLVTEIDHRVHEMMFDGPLDGPTGVLVKLNDMQFKPVYWFINGRAFPDTLMEDFSPWLPNQPYSSLLRMQPDTKVLVRFIGAGRNVHPFHTHGENVTIIARDGRLLKSGDGDNLFYSDFTLNTVPGQTADAIWTWTAKDLGWDVFGHAPSDPCDPDHEHCPGGPYPVAGSSHGKPVPVYLPQTADQTFGGFYSGSPFLGSFGDLPPGEGGLNANAGIFMIWHSHNEFEIVNNDIFPGGMITMMVIEPLLDPADETGSTPLVIPRGSCFDDATGPC